MPPVWTKDNKSADNTWKRYLRRGKDTIMEALSDFTFTDPVEEDSDPTVADATLSSFTANSVVWANDNKSASPTWTKENQS